MRTSLQFPDRPTAESYINPSWVKPSAAGVAITVYAAWNARIVLGAWQHSPFDRCGFVAFILWIVPVACLFVARRLTERPTQASSAAFGIALLLSFAGVAMDLSVLEYAGLAIALAGFLPVQGATFVWLVCAAAWMPAAGWAFSAHGYITVNAMRVAVGLLAVFLTPLFLRRESIF